MSSLENKTDSSELIELKPIGYVKSSRSEIIDDNWDKVSSKIILDSKQFSSESLAGLETFSHVEIIYHFSKVPDSSVQYDSRHPRNNKNWPKIGIFAQRGKNRPNKLGLTICKIVSVDAKNLTIEIVGLDAVDSTPVLDIKPYVKEFGPRGEVSQPDWMNELMQQYW
jgi:tRNA-Thr(GGU) m(6)t(6)A37 methyltransferase TsaA